MAAPTASAQLHSTCPPTPATCTPPFCTRWVYRLRRNCMTRLAGSCRSPRVGRCRYFELHGFLLAAGGLIFFKHSLAQRSPGENGLRGLAFDFATKAANFG